MAKSNLPQLKRRINKILDEKKLRSHIQRASTLVENEAKKSIMKGGTGITYQKYNPRRQHIASAPNEPPASDTGFLVNSISSNVTRKTNSVVGQIIASAPYAPYLEFGTKEMLEKGGPRPFMQPALEKNKARIMRIFKRGGLLK